MEQNVKTCLNVFYRDLQAIINIFFGSNFNHKDNKFLPFYSHDYSVLSSSQTIKRYSLETFDVMKRIFADNHHIFQDIFDANTFHFLQDSDSCFCPFYLVIRQFLASYSLHRLNIPYPL